MIEDPGQRELIEKALDMAEFRVSSLQRGQKDLSDIISGDLHVAFIGLSATAMENDPVFISLITRKPPPPCIIVAEDGREQEAVESLRQGAFDYLLSSDSVDRVRVAAGRAMEHRQALIELSRVRSTLRKSLFSLEPLGGSDPMIALKSLVEKAAGTEGNVIIEGEPGSGKRSTARLIHSMSQRHDGPFVEVSCNLVPESLVESEFFGREIFLYGHENRIRQGKIEQADGGTLYLEDIQMLTPGLRRRLLRTIREGKVEREGGTASVRVNVRFIASSTRDIESSVYSGGFPKDLYDELGSISMGLPSLRARRDDIPLLLSRLMDEHSKKLGREAPGIERAAMQRLLEYPWPGNLDELTALAETLSRRMETAPVTAADLPDNIRIPVGTGEGKVQDMLQVLSSISIPENGVRLATMVDGLEKALIIKALNRTGGLQREAARLLGLKRTTLLEKMKKKGIS